MSVVFTTDVGTRIRLDTSTDLTGYSEVKILALSPTGTAYTLAASVVDSKKIEHTKTATTLNEEGTWTLQAYVKFADGTEYKGDLVSLVVREPIA